MIEPMYRVEMTPIQTEPTNSGEHSTKFPISGRVIEAYRGSHIGQFWHGADGKLHISVYIQEGSTDRTIDADRLV